MSKTFEHENECERGVSLLIQKIPVEYILCARHCSRYQERAVPGDHFRAHDTPIRLVLIGIIKYDWLINALVSLLTN
jgi:hypothetical protein